MEFEREIEELQKRFDDFKAEVLGLFDDMDGSDSNHYAGWIQHTDKFPMLKELLNNHEYKY